MGFTNILKIRVSALVTFAGSVKGPILVLFQSVRSPFNQQRFGFLLNINLEFLIGRSKILIKMESAVQGLLGNAAKESTETYSLELTPYKGLCIVVCLLNGQ